MRLAWNKGISLSNRNFQLRRTKPLWSICTLSFLICLMVLPSSAQDKKRVAVLNFDYGTVQSSVAGLFGTNVDVGKGVSDLIVQKLVEDGRYSVIERNALDKVLAEQNFSNSDRGDSSSGAKIGRVLGVDAVIMGMITQFGRDDQSTTLGGAATANYTSKFGLGGIQKRKAKAVVGITARMVDTSTAQILAAVTGSGESTRAGTSLLGAGGNDGGQAGGAYDMSSKNFADTILGEAVHKAVDSLGNQLDAQATSLPTHKVQMSGLVADVTGNTLILNVGTKTGLRIGDTLDVSRPVRTIKDPATGKVIKTITNKVGTVTITEVDEASATATYKGEDPAKVGDAVSNGDAKADSATAGKGVPVPVPNQPSVVILQDGRNQPIPLTRAIIVQTKTKPSPLGGLASDETMNGNITAAMSSASQNVAAASMIPGNSNLGSTMMMANPMVGGAMMAGRLFSHRKQMVTEVWTIARPKSETVIRNPQPAFEVYCENLTAIKADEYEPVLLKLEPGSNFRLVGATEVKQDELQASSTEWKLYSSFVEERIAGRVKKSGTGSYQLQPSSPLPEGEYALALRPINKDKKFSAVSLSQNVGDGLVFNSVWSFEVQ